MNAIVGLCHFCEAHGPKPVFCTFTTEDENNTTESTKSAVQCSGCTSLGPETVLVSRENGTIFCSRESLPNSDVTGFLRQAALRSITCEVAWDKEGGVVYFSEVQGHVLSLTFQIKDTRARGLKRMFSIVVLMKDNMLLLNITPTLSEHMQRIARELQSQADVVYESEQSICSQRALRLKTGINDFGQSRSLCQLTDNPDVFKQLHSNFTWMLRTGAITYSETLYTSQDLLQKLTLKGTHGTIFEKNVCNVSNEDVMPLRQLESVLTKPIFRILLYCILVGININIKARSLPPMEIIKSLSSLVPNKSNDINRIKAVSDADRVTELSSICYLEEENNTFSCKWSGILPIKCPTLMVKIENAMSNDKINDSVLNQHIKSLQLEWLGIANTLKTVTKSSSQKSEAVKKLKQVLGVKQEDESLIDYWCSSFCD